MGGQQETQSDSRAIEHRCLYTQHANVPSRHSHACGGRGTVKLPIYLRASTPTEA